MSAGAVVFIWLVFMVVYIGAAFWIYQDAQKNSSQPALLWAALVLLCGILIPFILYFLIGRDQVGGRY